MLIQEVNLSGHIVLWKKQKWELCIGLKYGAELIVRMSFLGRKKTDKEDWICMLSDTGNGKIWSVLGAS